MKKKRDVLVGSRFNSYVCGAIWVRVTREGEGKREDEREGKRGVRVVELVKNSGNETDRVRLIGTPADLRWFAEQLRDAASKRIACATKPTKPWSPAK